MKRLVLRFAALAVLVLSGALLFSNQLPSRASSRTSCWEDAYNKWNECDGAYSNTVGTYDIQGSYCTWENTTTCSSADNTTCNATATAACTNSPNPSACFDAAHDSCCSSHNYNNCITTVNDNYSNRNNAYTSCLGMEGNLGNCIEQMQNGCDSAASRVSICATIYAEDYEAYTICRANTGIDQCQ
jgi:hypothetical protein